MNTNLDQSIAYRRLPLMRKFLLLGFALPLTFDFKKVDGEEGIVIQSILLGLTIISAGLFILFESFSPRIRLYGSLLKRATFFWWLYLFFSLLPVIIWGVNIEHYLKVLLPLVLFGIALLVMCSIERHNVDPNIILEMLLWAGLIGSIWNIFYTIIISGFDLNYVRWQIISPSSSLLIAFGAAGLYLKKFNLLYCSAFLLGTSIAILSVTRSFLILFFFVYISLWLIEVRRRSLSSAVFYGFKIGFISTIIIFIGSIFVAYFVPDITSSWAYRLTGHKAIGNIDITLITRLSEYKGQWEAFTKNATTILIGNGIGADYYFDKAILAVLLFDIKDVAWFGGHSTWLYPFFSSGVIMGFIVPLVLIFGIKFGYSAASKYAINSQIIGSTMAFVGSVAYIAQSFTSNILTNRYGALILGVLIGSNLLYYTNCRRLNKTKFEKNDLYI